MLLWCLCFVVLSVPESKVSIIKVIRSVLRENVRRNMKTDGTMERSCKERLAPLRGTRPSSARLGERSEACLGKICLCVLWVGYFFQLRSVKHFRPVSKYQALLPGKAEKNIGQRRDSC